MQKTQYEFEDKKKIRDTRVKCEDKKNSHNKIWIKSENVENGRNGTERDFNKSLAEASDE